MWWLTKDLEIPQVETVSKECFDMDFFSRSSSSLHNKSPQAFRSFMHVFFGTFMFTHSVIDKVVARLRVSCSDPCKLIYIFYAEFQVLSDGSQHSKDKLHP